MTRVGRTVKTAILIVAALTLSMAMTGCGDAGVWRSERDDFAKGHGIWPVGFDGSSIWGYNAPVYQVTINTRNRGVIVPAPFSSRDEASMSVTAWEADSAYADTWYGIAFGIPRGVPGTPAAIWGTDFYAFVVRPQYQQWQLNRCRNGAWDQSPVLSGGSMSINKDGRSNYITVETSGSYVTLSINGNRVGGRSISLPQGGHSRALYVENREQTASWSSTKVMFGSAVLGWWEYPSKQAGTSGSAAPPTWEASEGPAAPFVDAE